MSISELKKLWSDCFEVLLTTKFSDEHLDSLAKQTNDSIRRIKVYKAYKTRALNASSRSSSKWETRIPFVLAQRIDLSNKSKLWVLFLATYFGKSNKSKWTLFYRAAFDENNVFIEVESILENRRSYFNHLERQDFFADANYSNHRKYIAKSLGGERGLIKSMNYFLDNICQFELDNDEEFKSIYSKSYMIPNFGRMAAFDFTCSLCKCDLKVLEPLSMYHKSSTGPLEAIELMLELSSIANPDKKMQIDIGNSILEWFLTNSTIYMVAQVIEDAICNWQKNPSAYIRYFG